MTDDRILDLALVMMFATVSFVAGFQIAESQQSPQLPKSSPCVIEAGSGIVATYDSDADVWVLSVDTAVVERRNQDAE